MRKFMSRGAAAVVAAVVGVVLVAIALIGWLAPSDHHPARSAVTQPSARVVEERPQPKPKPPHTKKPPMKPAKKPAQAPHAVPRPVSVRIPAIGIQSGLIPLGLNPDNTLEVPKDFGVAGWYTGRPVPGEKGPSIIAGHVDSKTGPAVFYRLRDVRPGAAVEVKRSDGTIAKFTVVRMEQVHKDAFPSGRVYGPTRDAELRLITCGGDFNHSTGHYVDNFIVFAKLAAIAR